jgi:hypothetical protein
MSGCNECGYSGFKFPWRDDTGLACVEKCDNCGKFEYDDEAAATLASIVMPKGYSIVHMVLPGCKWEDAGAAAFVVAKLAGPTGSKPRLLSFAEGVKLAKELGLWEADGAEKLISAAEKHGQESGIDHQVGDLEQVVRACWEKLDEEGRQAVINACDDVLSWNKEG